MINLPFTLPIIDVKTDPLDALLYGLGLRLSSLAKNATKGDTYHQLVKDKELAIQFKSNDGVARYYRFVNGQFGQMLGTADHADLTIEFKDSMTGVRLLTKGDIATFMSAIQDGEVVISGDYKLVLWFAGIAKHAVTIPEPYAGYVKEVKPYVAQVRPYVDKARYFAKQFTKK